MFCFAHRFTLNEYVFMQATALFSEKLSVCTLKERERERERERDRDRDRDRERERERERNLSNTVKMYLLS